MIKIPTSDIHHVTNQRAFRWHHYGLRVEVNAHSDITFETTSRKERDEIVRLLRQAIDEIGDNKLKEKMADMTIFQQELDEQRQSEALKLAKTVNEDDSSDNLPPLPTGALKWVGSYQRQCGYDGTLLTSYSYIRFPSGSIRYDLTHQEETRCAQYTSSV